MGNNKLQWVEDLIRAIPEEEREEIRRQILRPEVLERAARVRAARI
jgi:hypothetical protein